jgi:hypothetical protein
VGPCCAAHDAYAPVSVDRQHDYGACARSPVDLPANDTAIQLLRLLDETSKLYADGDPCAQLAALLAVGRAIGRSALSVAHTSGVFAGRATDDCIDVL